MPDERRLDKAANPQRPQQSNPELTIIGVFTAKAKHHPAPVDRNTRGERLGGNVVVDANFAVACVENSCEWSDLDNYPSRNCATSEPNSVHFRETSDLNFGASPARLKAVNSPSRARDKSG